MSRKQVESEYWICIIGGTNSKNLPDGADQPLRSAVKNAFAMTTGHHAETCWSGWGTEKGKVDVLNAIWTLREDDPLYVSLQTVLKASGRL